MTEPVHPVTPEELAEEVWADESPAAGEHEAGHPTHDPWHPDVNELLEHSASFEE